MNRKQNHYREEKCLVCKNMNLQTLLFAYSRYNPKLFYRIALCTDCGHIQQYPLFKKDEYAIINDRFFGTKYLVGGNENIYNNTPKLKTY